VCEEQAGGAGQTALELGKCPPQAETGLEWATGAIGLIRLQPAGLRGRIGAL